MGHSFREQLGSFLGAEAAAEYLKTGQTVGGKTDVAHVLGTTVAVHTSMQFPSIHPSLCLKRVGRQQSAGEKLGAWSRCYRRMLPSKPINGHPEVRDEVVGGRRKK